MASVIQNKGNFLLALKPEEAFVKVAAKDIIKVVVVAIAIAVIATLFVQPIAIVIFILGGLKMWYNRYKAKHPGSFITRIGRLGEEVADIVFNPLIGMAKLNGSLQEREKEFIKSKMAYWGYSDVFISQFIDGSWKKTEGKVFKKEINRPDLQNKAKNMCRELYNYLGIEDKKKELYIRSI